MATLLSVRNLAKAHAARPLFTELTFGIDDDARIGLIGPNGAGKSTLLKLLAGIETPDRGEISRRRGLRTGYVAQEESFAAGHTVRQLLEKAIDDGTTDADERHLRAEIALASAELGPYADQEAGTLSGGWQKRVAIMVQRIAEPELLLLDEPTNHLDLAGVEWLEGLLSEPDFAFVVVTHDRYFLENVAGRILEVAPVYAEGILSVDGAYSDFVEARAAYRSAQISRQDSLESQARRELAWLRRGARARSTKAKGRIEDAGELFAELSEVKRRNTERATFAADGFSASGRRTRELLVGKGLGKAMGGRALFSGLDLVLSPGMKLGLIGANGSGKTTLLRLLAGALEPDTGTLKRAERLQTVWFDQNRTGVDRDATLRDALSPTGDTVLFRGNAMHISAWARKFGFRDEQLGSRVSTLSGGEQARVALAGLMLVHADLLILDEPTNDLDIPSLDLLEDALVGFPGALILVSHDRYLLDTVANGVLVLGEGAPSFYADFAQWEESRRPAAPIGNVKTVGKPAAIVAPRPGLTSAERRELARMEETIQAAEEKVAQIEAQMNAPQIATDAAALRSLWEVDLPAAKAAVERLYSRWEALEARA
jgi:ATP-binding cassette subfamily F protein uup